MNRGMNMKVKDIMVKCCDDQKIHIEDYLYWEKIYFNGKNEDIPLEVQNLTVEEIFVFNNFLILKVSNV